MTTVKTEGIYRVSTSGDGADYAVIADASAAAWTEYRAEKGLPDGADLPAGVLRFQPGDGQIVITWAVEEVTTT